MHHHLHRIALDLNDDDEGLSGERWEFYMLDNKLAVDTYMRWTKQSNRHKKMSTDHWSRLDPRTSTLRKEMIPLTPDVKAMAKKAWLAQLEAEVVVDFA